MKITSLILALVTASIAQAGTQAIAPVTPAPVAPSMPAVASAVESLPEAMMQAVKEPQFTGSLTTGVMTAYTGRGYLPTRAGTMGDGAGMTALKLNFATDTDWSFHSTIAYTYIMSGHTLFGGAKFGPHTAFAGRPLPEKNIENEFVVATEIRYTPSEQFSVGFGHDYIHGGLLGVMAKHFAHEGASSVNEFFVKPTYTPYKWMELSVAARYSTQGVEGWWFEPSVTFKAPLIGTAENVKMAGLLSFHMSATGDYFQDYHGACANGSQAWWIKLSTPYYLTEKKNLILTPSVSFHWLGKGAIRANKLSDYALYTGDSHYVPFQNFGVVGSLMLTYTF